MVCAEALDFVRAITSTAPTYSEGGFVKERLVFDLMAMFAFELDALRAVAER